MPPQPIKGMGARPAHAVQRTERQGQSKGPVEPAGDEAATAVPW